MGMLVCGIVMPVTSKGRVLRAVRGQGRRDRLPPVVVRQHSIFDIGAQAQVCDCLA